MSKATPMTGSLVAVKGAAGVSTLTTEQLPTELIYPKAMTLKLDPVRYKKLKQLGVDRGKSSQDLLVQAVDLLLDV